MTGCAGCLGTQGTGTGICLRSYRFENAASFFSKTAASSNLCKKNSSTSLCERCSEALEQKEVVKIVVKAGKTG